MISIVIPNYNGSKYLKRCIDKIIEFNYLDIEIIVIDNRSVNSTYEWIINYSDVLFHRLDKNYGFSRIVNITNLSCVICYKAIRNVNKLFKRIFAKNSLW